ncbi:cell division initiation protein [Streptomyces roseoverticillatus]|uniref:ATP synthase F0 subunit B n=1 Tax=Streptomyces roseoverticillatus TaxID=66429 RepID=UPI001F386A5A|nr:ATP synthase F0 subunit B [Streptomyces roseoverticillatus]MCF3105834.1 cell division initiation protein [Streptomyces roseoverticillatus]
MDVQKKLDEIVATVTAARSMPMSASCVINRAELLALLEELRAGLPGALARAQEVVGDREQLVAEAREEAERIIESARAHRGSLISDTEVARQSQEEADRILAEARRQAEETRTEADDYVDSKLANFEVVLTKTIGSVDRGREKLLGRTEEGGGQGDPGGDAPEPSSDPRVQRQQADAYVDAKLGAVSAVLSKTLEAVGRGREKLLGARPADELGAHMAAQDGLRAAHPTSDADFLAGLAAPQAPAAPEPAAAAHGAPHAAPHAGGYEGYYDPQAYQPDPYTYQQQYGTDSGSHGHQPDPYAVQSGYQQADPYAWPAPAPNDGYGAAQGGYAPQQHQPAQSPPHAGGALDETSLFDTSMIDLEQLRRYEQGR